MLVDRRALSDVIELYVNEGPTRIEPECLGCLIRRCEALCLLCLQAHSDEENGSKQASEGSHYLQS